MTDQKLLAYVGTYTARGSEGIYVYSLDPSTGALAPAGTPVLVDNPTFLAIHPSRRTLYAVNEVGTFDGKPGGAVSAFSIDPTTGALTFLNQQASHGVAPCHLSVDQTGRFVFVANYSGGNLAVLPIAPDGSLGAATDVVQHHGSSVNPRRQKKPHAHSITLDPTNRYAFAANLGTDKIMIYRIDLSAGKLIPHDEPWVSLHPGAGPRHFAFHPSLEQAYVINELDSTLTAFAYDQAAGTLSKGQTISTLPIGASVDNTCADVHVSPSGRFIYGSNRGHNSIAIIEIDSDTGQLTCVGHEPTQGKTPRNFALDPTGSFLFAANQDTDTIVAFRVNQETGRLTPTSRVTAVSMPVCIQIVSLETDPS